jgi:hypothetical protein
MNRHFETPQGRERWSVPPGLKYLFSNDTDTSGRASKHLAIKLARLYERDRWRLSMRRLGEHVDRLPLDRPIFLLGVAGCGATLIGRSLRRNRAVVSMSGNSDYWTGIDELGIVRNRMQRLPPVLWGNKFRTDLDDEVQGTTHLFACDALLPHYRMTAADGRRDDGERYVRLLREHIAVYAHEPSRARFLDKTHANTVKIPLLAKLLERHDPFFLLVTRNPYASCPWIVRRKPPSFRVELSYERQLELTAEHWDNAYRIALDDGQKIDRFAVVRYEDWIADPVSSTKRLCTMLELEFDPAMLPQPGQSRPFATLPSDRKWFPLYPDTRLENLTEAEADVIGARCDTLAERLGYAASNMGSTQARHLQRGESHRSRLTS